MNNWWYKYPKHLKVWFHERHVHLFALRPIEICFSCFIRRFVGTSEENARIRSEAYFPNTCRHSVFLPVPSTRPAVTSLTLNQYYWQAHCLIYWISSAESVRRDRHSARGNLATVIRFFHALRSHQMGHKIDAQRLRRLSASFAFFRVYAGRIRARSGRYFKVGRVICGARSRRVLTTRCLLPINHANAAARFSRHGADWHQRRSTFSTQCR